MDETQQLDATTNDLMESAANTGTLVLEDENDKIKKLKAANNGCIAPMSKYCLKLELASHEHKNGNANSDSSIKHEIFPLSIGINKIGRSDTNTICILNKSISKKHGCIELSVTETGDLDKCQLWDIGSMNKIKLNSTSLKLEEKYTISLNDTIEFGFVKFSLAKMDDAEFKEQESNRAHVVKLDDFSENSSLNKCNGKSKSNKIGNLFEIQQTLDDTTPIEETNGDESHSHKNGNSKIYVDDTDPEDEETNGNGDHADELDDSNSIVNKTNLNNTSCADFHLEMSQSIIINQSTISNGKSFLIPETMVDNTDDEDIKKEVDKKEAKEEEAKKEDNTPNKEESNAAETQIINNVLDQSKEKNGLDEAKPSDVQETVVLADEVVNKAEATQSLVEETVKVDEKEPEPVVNGEAHVAENIVEEKEQIKDTVDSKTVSDTVPVELTEKPVEMSETKKEEEEAKQEENVVEEKKVEPVEEAVEEPVKEVVAEDKVEKVEEFKKPLPATTTTPKINSDMGASNDDSIIINDDEDEVSNDEKKSNLFNGEKSALNIRDKLNESGSEIILESTIMDKSINAETTDTEKKANKADEAAVDEPASSGRGRGRGRKSNAAKKAEIEAQQEAKKDEEVEENNEEEASARPRRSVRASLPPVVNKKEPRKSLSVLQKKKAAAQEHQQEEEENEKAKDDEVVAEPKVEDKKEEESVVEKPKEKEEETHQVETVEEKEEQAVEPKQQQQKPEEKEEAKEEVKEEEPAKLEKPAPTRGRRGLKAKEKEEEKEIVEKEEEKKPTETTGIARRSSLRVRNPPAAVANLKEQLKQKKAEAEAEKAKAKAKKGKKEEEENEKDDEEKSDEEEATKKEDPVEEEPPTTTTKRRGRASLSAQPAAPPVEATTSTTAAANETEAPAKRGRGRRATQVIKKEDLKIDEEKEKEPEKKAEAEAEPEVVEKKGTALKRRGSLASTLKPKADTAVEAKAEPATGKMTRNRRQTISFSTAAATTAPTTTAKTTRKKKQEVEEPIPESEKEEEAEEEEQEAEEETKEEKKPAKNKRVSISAKTVVKKRKQEKGQDTYSYDESDNDGKGVAEKKTKASKAKAQKEEAAAVAAPEPAVESEKPKKSRKSVKSSSTASASNNKAVSETETTEGELDDSKTTNKRVRKRKSLNNSVNKSKSEENASATPTVSTTPKLFFHSKQNKTPGSSSANESNKKRYSSNILSITPNKAAQITLNSSASASATHTSKLDTSQSKATPNKKFKLHKAKSSSSENLNISSSSEESDNETLANMKRKSKLNTSSSNKKSPATTTKHVSIKLPEKQASDNEADESKLEESTTEKKEVKSKPGRKPRKSSEKAAENVKTPSPPAKTTKRTTSRSSLQSGEASTEQATRNSSRSKLSLNAAPKIMATGILLNEKQKQIITNLGGQLVTDVKECTHLITNKVRKTYKFLSCLSRGAHILNERWLEESNKSKMFLNTTTFALQDAQSEKHYKFTLQTSLQKAKMTPLLSDWKFLLVHEDSPNEELSRDDIKLIIECASGELVDSLPADEEQLAKCCIIYSNYDKYQEDALYKSNDVLKMTLDTFLNSILKQSFDIFHKINQDNPNSSVNE